jgi:hypothetical protein
VRKASFIPLAADIAAKARSLATRESSAAPPAAGEAVTD